MGSQARVATPSSLHKFFYFYLQCFRLGLFLCFVFVSPVSSGIRFLLCSLSCCRNNSFLVSKDGSSAVGELMQGLTWLGGLWVEQSIPQYVVPLQMLTDWGICIQALSAALPSTLISMNNKNSAVICGHQPYTQPHGLDWTPLPTSLYITRMAHTAS